MNLQDPKLQEIFGKIMRVVEQYPSLREALSKSLFPHRVEPTGLSFSDEDRKLLQSMEEELQEIRQIMGISRYIGPSIDYSFVDDEGVRERLRYDNLRMEYESFRFRGIVPHVAMSRDESYDNCCLYAFYQIEGLLRWAVTKLYHSPEDFREAYNQAEPKFEIKNPISDYKEINIGNLIYLVKKLLEKRGKTYYTYVSFFLQSWRNALVHPSSTKEEDRAKMEESREKYYSSVDVVCEKTCDYLNEVIDLLEAKGIV